MPLLAPLGGGEGFSNQSLNMWLDSIRKICLPKMLQKLRKCEIRIPIKPLYMPLLAPLQPPPEKGRVCIFFLYAKLEHMVTLHKKDMSAQNASKA